MKKLLVICFLFIVIGLSLSFSWVKIQASGPDDNYFNRELRSRFTAVPFFRHVLSLHYDGDARADYLGGKYKKIVIEVDTMQDIGARYEALDLLRDRVRQITGKPTSYIISDNNILYEREVDETGIEKLVKQYRNRESSDDTAVLYLLYASSSADQPDLLGLTYQEYGIILFYNALQDFTDENPKVLVNYEASTALHEFGHQIGLPHNERQNCLMNKSAEMAHIPREIPEDVITDFCEHEKNAIRIYE